MQRRHWIGLLFAMLFVLPATAQGKAWIQTHYLKREAFVPMRDGVKLFTVVYSPKEPSKPYPILLERTPYGVEPYGRENYPEELGASAAFAKEGFIFVFQDVRGRFMSEGTFLNMTPHKSVKTSRRDVDESTDTFDTITWLLANVSRNNGRVGQLGISYPGFYTAAGMIDAHPAMVAVSPQAPIMDWFAGDDFHRNGAFWLPHCFNFIADFGRPRSGPTTRWPEPFQHGTDDGYAFFLKMGPLQNANKLYFHNEIQFWNETMAHGTGDAYWQDRNLRPHLKAIRPAVLVVGGWFDAENLYGSLQLFKTLERQSPATREYLVMGPWCHGGWERNTGEALGDVRFGSATSQFFLDQIELPFFVHYLKEGPDPKFAKAMVFETGANRWERFEAWPPRQDTPMKIYFQASGTLGFQAPKSEDGLDSFLSDPANPVPFFPGKQIGMPIGYMVADQRFVASRPDVLTYQTPLLDADLVVAGPIQVHLVVSTTGTDADWVVKVIDVHPEDAREKDAPPGDQQLVRGEVMRGKFRKSLEHPEPFIPDQPTVVEYTLNDVFHDFRKGHRLMVQVQSTWFPLMDRNPQVFTDIYSAAESDFHAATHRLYRSASRPSYLELPVLEAQH